MSANGDVYSQQRKYRARRAARVTINNGSDGQTITFDIKNRYFIKQADKSFGDGKRDIDKYPNDKFVFADQIAGRCGESADNPYILYLDEPFELFHSGTDFNFSGNAEFYSNGEDTSICYETNVQKESIPGYLKKYTPTATGDAVFTSTTDGQNFYVRVVDPCGHANDKIKVKTEYEEKPIDRVKEYLNRNLNLKQGTGVNEGYVLNGVGQYKVADTPRPYVVRQGDEFEVYVDGNVTQGAVTYDNYDEWFDGSRSWSCVLKVSNSQKLNIVQYTYDSEKNRTVFKFKPEENIGDSVVNIHFGEVGSMWVRVYPTSETFHHADMEIADGGKYTVTSTTIDENGQKVTTLKVYDAFVSSVVTAKLLGANGKPLQLELGSGEFADEFTSKGDVTKVGEKTLYGDYVRIGEEGKPQYELSSADGRQKRYDINSVKNVEFIVDITLLPKKQCVVPTDSNGNWVWKDLAEENKELTNVTWNFDQQGILDAMNKCPLGNGLDFTLRANAALIDLKAIKKLNGGDGIIDRQFTFQLYDNNNKPIGGTVTNDADGNIVFLDMMYEEPGKYEYTIHEVVPENADSRMIYAPDQKITIEVSEVQVPIDGGGTIKALKAEMVGDPPTLTNYVTYRLPDTGGVGNLPYYLGGTVLLAASALLFEKKRREGR